MGLQTVTFEIPAGRRAAVTARRALAATLDSWDLHDRPADAELIVSELISNAVMHAAGASTYELRISRNDTGLGIGVTDQSATKPTIRSPADGQPGGRGLRIVAALATTWGYEPTTHGQHVWGQLGSSPSRRDP